MAIDPAREVIDVHVFESPALPDHWPRLDTFEGAGYRRVVTQVSTAEGELVVSIYVIDT